MILYFIDGQGGFVCGDTETGRTAYAYPTSSNASRAARSTAEAAQVAREMMERANAFVPNLDTDLGKRVKAHDERLMARLKEEI